MKHSTLIPALCAISLTICMVAGSQPASAADPLMSPPLGRLFMSPEERHALDAGKSTAASPDDPDGAVRTPEVSRFVLNGVLKRSAGPDVVWINGQPAGHSDSAVQIRRGPDSQNTVTLLDTADGRSVRLKPGQSWTP